MQVFGDTFGNIVHFYERDCSLQRRHQKVIEEAPATNISTDVRKEMAFQAEQVAKNISYSGAGTIEFLLENNNFYFITFCFTTYLIFLVFEKSYLIIFIEKISYFRI